MLTLGSRPRACCRRYLVELSWSIDTVTITDLHTDTESAEGGCGPVLTPITGTDTKVNCDRGYEFGGCCNAEGGGAYDPSAPQACPMEQYRQSCSGDSSNEFGDWSEFFSQRGPQFWIIQDAHDPTDQEWAHNLFAAVTIPASRQAMLYVVVCQSCDAVNTVDPLGGWEITDTVVTGRNDARTVWRKQIEPRSIRGTDVPMSYNLYHFTAGGHGYIYFVELL